MQEKNFNPFNGWIFLFIDFIVIATLAYMIYSKNPIGTVVSLFVFLFISFGFFIIYPNGSRVLTLFGKYVGSVKSDGFYWANPFFIKKKISLRACNFDSERVKVNDKMGNPILISVILVYRVQNTFKAAFEVDYYERFVKVQSDAAVRKLAVMYSYDNFDDEQEEITLRSAVEQVNMDLEKELQERLIIAGIEVIEARIGYLAYAPEIANAMLKRQQAEAIVAARLKIVEGAVSMVDNALEALSEQHIVELDEEKKASMVSNLMVVLCSDREVTPVVNTGTLHN